MTEHKTDMNMAEIDKLKKSWEALLQRNTKQNMATPNIFCQQLASIHFLYL